MPDLAPQFTAGPWTIKRHPTCFGVYGRDGYNIATLTLGYKREAALAEKCATAHLIKSAPELYLELEAAALIFRAYEGLHLEKGTEDGARKARRNAAYAKSIERILAKARGEEQ
jgi:hypothetical protein